MNSVIVEIFSLPFTNSESQSYDNFVETSMPQVVHRLRGEAQLGSLPQEVKATFELVPRDANKISNYLSNALGDLQNTGSQLQQEQEKNAELTEAIEALKKRLEDHGIVEEEESEEEKKDALG